MVEDSRKATNQPIIMPGSGLTPRNIETIHAQLQASEYHFGSAVRIDGNYLNPINGEDILMIKRIIT
jgi:copper homeostasis protein